MATSNFKSLGSLPLYVFHTEGEAYALAEDEIKTLNIRDFDTYEDFEDKRGELLDKYEDELSRTGIVLTDSDIDELSMDVDDLNNDIKSLIENDYSYDYTDEEVNLEDIATFDISYGYYEGGQITNKHPDAFDDLNDEHQEFILDHLKAIAEKFDLTELRTGARFGNGETMYSVKREGKEMNESSAYETTEEEYMKALSRKLNIPYENMTATIERDFLDNGYCIVTIEDDESKYIVADRRVAEELAEEQVREDFEKHGLDAFSPNFATYICNNFYDRDFVESTVKEYIDNEVVDMHGLDARDSKFETRFEEECYEHNVLGDEDFEENEDGVWVLKDQSDANIDELNYQLEDAIFYDISDHYEYLCDIMGEEAVRDLLVENNAFDEYAIAEETVHNDGIGIFLATYDSDELDLGDNLVAYRIK